MRWIGQNIFDLKSRFKDDVVIEKTIVTSDGASVTPQSSTNGAIIVGGATPAAVTGGDLAGSGLGATTGNGTLVLAVDNPLNQNTTGSSGSCTGQAATVATIAGLAPNTATTQATQPNIDSIGTDGDSLSILGDNLIMENNTAGRPIVRLDNKTDDTSAPSLQLVNSRRDAGSGMPTPSHASDRLGLIEFRGYNDNATPAVQSYARITAECDVAVDGQESGQLKLQVMNHDGGISTALDLEGGSETNEVDAIIGCGANSTVTIPGKIQGDYTPILSVITDCAITPVPGTEYVINDANGGAMTLPYALQGSRITIIIGTILVSDMTITGIGSGCLLKGHAFMEATDAANNKTYFAPDGSDDLIITLNGSTKGGLVGDKIELIGISPLEWRVRATLSHTGSAVNPFS